MPYEPKQIKWTDDTGEMKLEAKIAGRFLKLAKKQKLKYKKLDVIMDIDACHCNGNPLRLADLLAASDFDLIHDVGGITAHIDRRTGKLRNCFVPRYSKKAAAAVAEDKTGGYDPYAEHPYAERWHGSVEALVNKVAYSDARYSAIDCESGAHVSLNLDSDALMHIESPDGENLLDAQSMREARQILSDFRKARRNNK